MGNSIRTRRRRNNRTRTRSLRLRSLGKINIVTQMNSSTKQSEMEEPEEIGSCLWPRPKKRVRLDPTIYRKHKWYNKQGKLILYKQLKMSLYGTLQADY